MPTITSIAIRYAFVLLFLWFGTKQITGPAIWITFLPQWAENFFISGEMLVIINCWFEIIFAFMFLAGFYTRFVFAVLGMHLLGIAAFVVGSLGVRDAVLVII